MILKNVNNGDKDMRNVVVSWWMSNYLLIFFFYLEIKCCHRGIFIHDFFFFLILISYVSHNGVDFFSCSSNLTPGSFSFPAGSLRDI